MSAAPKYRHFKLLPWNLPNRACVAKLPGAPAGRSAVAVMTLLGLTSALASMPMPAAADGVPPEAPQTAITPELHDVSQLETLARNAAIPELGALTDRQRLLVGPLQPHLQLQRCASPVKPVIGPARHMKDRVTVELRCAGPAAWHLYVPVRVIGTTPVALAAHAIVLGKVLTAADLRVEQHDMSELPPGYFDDPAIAVGLTAARAIAGGAIITNQQLVASKAVQRGQAVTLVADAGGMSVRMAGRALSDGLVNQRVRVQNLSSGKIVEGIARSEQVVEIIFQ
ncbi:MAG: flagellar basal body P-ring formation protein FlgA [Acetobacteraceae bacterium]|nr:flagellar basal body P-ring formation protein FlgA [Acetobacteraceae bacterium]